MGFWCFEGWEDLGPRISRMGTNLLEEVLCEV